MCNFNFPTLFHGVYLEAHDFENRRRAVRRQELSRREFRKFLFVVQIKVINRNERSHLMLLLGSLVILMALGNDALLLLNHLNLLLYDAIQLLIHIIFNIHLIIHNLRRNCFLNLCCFIFFSVRARLEMFLLRHTMEIMWSIRWNGSEQKELKNMCEKQISLKDISQWVKTLLRQKLINFNRRRGVGKIILWKKFMAVSRAWRIIHGYFESGDFYCNFWTELFWKTKWAEVTINWSALISWWVFGEF